jgi:hypothetical protein
LMGQNPLQNFIYSKSLIIRNNLLFQHDRYNNPLCNNTISLKSFQTNEVVDIMCKDNDCEYKILNMARYKKY